MKEGKSKSKSLNGSFVTGAIALVFLIIGYQAAVFIHKAASLRIAANRDHPDTVYVYVPAAKGDSLSGAAAEETPQRRNCSGSAGTRRKRSTEIRSPSMSQSASTRN